MALKTLKVHFQKLANSILPGPHWSFRNMNLGKYGMWPINSPQGHLYCVVPPRPS